MSERKIILGIDPGLNNTGWGIISSIRDTHCYQACGSIQTTVNDHLSIRLLKIFNQITEVINHYHPSDVAIEETYVNSNSKTSLHLAHARSAAIVATANMNLIPISYQSKTAKKVLTGSGSADKSIVAKMLRLRLQQFQDIKDKDAIDALSIAFCHAHMDISPPN